MQWESGLSGNSKPAGSSLLEDGCASYRLGTTKLSHPSSIREVVNGKEGKVLDLYQGIAVVCVLGCKRAKSLAKSFWISTRKNCMKRLWDGGKFQLIGLILQKFCLTKGNTMIISGAQIVGDI